MTNSSDQFDQIRSLLAETVQLTRSNSKAIEANSAAIAANRADIAATRASVDGLVQTIAEFSIRTEARLNKLDDAIAEIRTTNVRLELILRELTQRNGGNNPEP